MIQLAISKRYYAGTSTPSPCTFDPTDGNAIGWLTDSAGIDIPCVSGDVLTVGILSGIAGGTMGLDHACGATDAPIGGTATTNASYSGVAPVGTTATWGTGDQLVTLEKFGNYTAYAGARLTFHPLKWLAAAGLSSRRFIAACSVFGTRTTTIGAFKGSHTFDGPDTKSSYTSFIRIEVDCWDTGRVLLTVS